MQLNNMDCNTRTNNVERDSDLGDDMSHEDHSDDDVRDCDSLDGDHHVAHAPRRRLNKSRNLSDINFPSGVGGGSGGTGRSPLQHPDLQMSHHHHQFPPNHPLNALGNFMGIGGLHGIPTLQQQNDVLEKLKMQVRDMKMDQDYAAAAHAAAFGSGMIPSQLTSAFSLPPTSAASFGHAAQSLAVHPNAGNMGNNSANGPGALTNGSNSSANNSFSFASPTAPGNKEVNPASNSSTSSEASNSSQQNNGWSFEEQYKQVRQLYEINDDPKRKEFLDDLFSFMQKRGTPINRLPIMAKSVLDLYELYNLVIARGGLVDVINKKLWQEIIKGLHLPSSITSAAFTLRTQYMKYLYPYECEKKNLSTPAELQAAIDGNRREGRRSSYGQYEAMHNQMQMPQLARQTLAGSMQQMSPLALVTHAAAANNQQAQAAAAAAAAAHHRLMTPPFGQVPNLVKHEIEQRMMEYLKLIQAKEEHNASLSAVNGVGGAGGGLGSGGGGGDGNGNGGSLNPLAHSPLAHVQQQQQSQQQQHSNQQQQQQLANQQQSLQQQQRRRSQSPELSSREAALNALEMSRVAFWQMYNNTTSSPPASLHASPQANAAANQNDQQRNEALNLSDSPPSLASIKRERDRDGSPEPDRDDFPHQAPPAKRSIASSLMQQGFPNFYLPHNLAAAANFHHHAAAAAAAVSSGSIGNHHQDQDSDNEHDDEDHEDDMEEDDDRNPHNTTTTSSNHDENDLHHHHPHHHHLHPHHLNIENHLQNERQHQDNKSDDSAIENSPTTTSSAGGGGVGGVGTNGHLSPISTKKIHLSKQHLQHHQQQQQQKQQQKQQKDEKQLNGSKGGVLRESRTNSKDLDPLETLNLLSGMQFKVARNGLGPNGEQQLLVSLELNGIKYSGLLLANVKENDLISLGNNNNNNNGKASPRKLVNSNKMKNSSTTCLTVEQSPNKTLDNYEKSLKNVGNIGGEELDEDEDMENNENLCNLMQTNEEEQELRQNNINNISNMNNINNNNDDGDDENFTEHEEEDEEQDDEDMENNRRKAPATTTATTTITATTLLTKDSILTPLTPTKNKLSNNGQVSSASSTSSSSSSSNSSNSSNASSTATTATTTSSASTAIQQLANGPSPVAAAAVVAAATASALQNLKDALITS